MPVEIHRIPANADHREFIVDMAAVEGLTVEEAVAYWALNQDGDLILRELGTGGAGSSLDPDDIGDWKVCRVHPAGGLGNLCSGWPAGGRDAIATVSDGNCPRFRAAAPDTIYHVPMYVDECAAVGISFVGCVGATESFPASVKLTGADFPAGTQPGDVAVIQAADDGETEIPTIPSPWTPIGSGGVQAPSIGYRGAYLVLEQSHIDNLTGWTFTDGDSIVGGVYRGVDTSDPIGTIAGDSGNTNVVETPGLTLEVADDSSWVIVLAHHHGAVTSGGTVDGAVFRCSERGGEHSFWDSNGGVSSWSADSFGVGSSNSWQSHSFEIKANQTP